MCSNRVASYVLIHTMVATRVNISPVKPGSGMYVGDGMLQCILSLLML